MSDKTKAPPLGRHWLLVLGVLALISSIGLWVQNFTAPALPRRELTITAGSPFGQRHLLAELLARELDRSAPDGPQLRVATTSGSVDARTRVNDGDLDLALVQGGLWTQGYQNVRHVCALHVEPLHLLVRSELAEDVAARLTALRGRSINLSTAGSGSNVLAREVLRFAGLPDGAFNALELSYDDLLRMEDPNALPDAAFMVSSLPSPVARELISVGYQLVALPFGAAFALDGLRRAEIEPFHTAPPTTQPAEVDQLQIYTAEIPPFTYGVYPPVPPAAIETLGTRLLLVAHRDVPAETVDALVEQLLQSKFAELLSPPITERNLTLPCEFPVHAGVRAYLARNDPIINRDHWEWFEQAVNVAAIFATGAVSLWVWFYQNRRKRRERSFAHYLMQIAEIENDALYRETRAQLKLQHLLPLQDRLRLLKREALDAFARGQMHGEEHLTGFLTQVADVRAYLTRLVLHERNNLEELAREQGRPLAEVWAEHVDATPPTAKP